MNEYADINNNGLITVKKDGKIKVKVTALDGSGVFAIKEIQVKKTPEIIPIKSITITTTTIQDAGQIQTSVSPENASIVKKEFELLSGSEYVVMNSTGYVSEVISPGTISVRVSGFDKVGNVVTNTKSISATNEFVKITGVSITTDTISNGNTIKYSTIPPSVPANLKSVKIELYNQGNSEYVNVNIDSSGKVTRITEDMDGKKFKAKITVVDKYNNVVSNTKEITCKSAILVTSITVPNQTITNSGNVNYTISPSNATNKNVKFSFKSSTSNATINSSTGKITVTNDGSVVVVVTAQDGSGVKGEGTVTLKKTSTELIDSYFLAKTARGNKTGKDSWDNATDDIKTIGYITSDESTIGAFSRDVYVETDKKSTLYDKELFYSGVKLIGGCEYGSFNPISSLYRSDFYNISILRLKDSMKPRNDVAINNCNFYNIGYCFFADRIMFANCDFHDIICTDATSDGICFSPNSIVTCDNCNFYNINVVTGSNGNAMSFEFNLTSTINNCNFYNINSNNDSWGLFFNSSSSPNNQKSNITNCTFSAIESNDSTKYTPYSDLIKILPPETTGCRFLPEGKAQSIYFDNNCIINGKKVSDLLAKP